MRERAVWNEPDEKLGKGVFQSPSATVGSLQQIVLMMRQHMMSSEWRNQKRSKRRGGTSRKQKRGQNVIGNKKPRNREIGKFENEKTKLRGYFSQFLNVAYSSASSAAASAASWAF